MSAHKRRAREVDALYYLDADSNYDAAEEAWQHPAEASGTALGAAGLDADASLEVPMRTALAASLVVCLVAWGAAAGLGWHHHAVVQAHAQSAGALERSLCVDTAGPPPPVGRKELEQPSSREPDSCYEAMLEMAGSKSKGKHPYEALTGLAGHQQPSMHGKVREKTIWSFWYDPEHCPASTRCVLPASVKLCAETIRRNQGSFDYRMIYYDQVGEYVSMAELPLHWRLFHPAQMKDAIASALLARYGGVALDVSTILFGPVDSLWDDLVKLNATFRGLVYRVGGKPWGVPETLASWFMMSRRQGVASVAVRNQVSTLCTRSLDPKFKLADHMLTPTLQAFNYSLPRCRKDPLVLSPDECPELDGPGRASEAAGPERNDGTLLLSDPREGPQLPFSLLDGFGMGAWKVSDSTPFRPEAWGAVDGLEERIPNADLCKSPKECWDEVFLPLFESTLKRMPFIKLFRSGGPLRGVGRQELVGNKGTFFYHWLKLAGLNTTELSASAVIHI